MNALLTPPRSVSFLDAPFAAVLPSLGASKESRLIEDSIKSMRRLLSEPATRIAGMADGDKRGLPVNERLIAKVASFKRMVSIVAMYLDPSWRLQLLSSIEELLDPDDWDEDFRLPSDQSFSTFLRMIIYLHPSKKPALGLSPRGHVLAAWARNDDRIVVECLGNDEVRWVISRTADGNRETGAGTVLLHRVPDVTAPYEAEALLCNGDKLLA